MGEDTIKEALETMVLLISGLAFSPALVGIALALFQSGQKTFA